MPKRRYHEGYMGGVSGRKLMRAQRARFVLAVLLGIALFVAGGCSLDFDRFRPELVPATMMDASAAAEGGLANDAGDDGDARAERSPASDGSNEGDAPLCPNGLAGHCYFLTASAASWDNARLACQTASAHLVTITSAAEQTAVSALGAAQDRWIGLSRPAGSAAVASSFRWITGELSTYANWDSDEPGSVGTCARMGAGARWADGACPTLLTAICERE